MLQPIWAMIKPFGFAVLWIWHPKETLNNSLQICYSFSTIGRSV